MLRQKAIHGYTTSGAIHPQKNRYVVARIQCCLFKPRTRWRLVGSAMRSELPRDRWRNHKR